MKFNHLNVPSHWQNYWTRYPEGHTILEALISWVSQVDDMVDNVNSWNEYLDNFVATFDKELQQLVTDTLSDWQTSGFLDVVISEALQWQLDDYIATNEQDKLSINQQLVQSNQLLEDLNLNVRDFKTETNTWNEALQETIDYATTLSSSQSELGGVYVTQNVEVKMPRGRYEITEPLVGKLGINFNFSGATFIANPNDKSINFLDLTDSVESGSGRIFRNEYTKGSFVGFKKVLEFQTANIDTSYFYWFNPTFQSCGYGIDTLSYAKSRSTYLEVKNIYSIKTDIAIKTHTDMTVLDGGWLFHSGHNGPAIYNQSFLHMKDVICVPSVFPNSTARWIDNYSEDGDTTTTMGERGLKLTHNRFGGEGGGIPIVYNYAGYQHSGTASKKTMIEIEGSQVNSIGTNIKSLIVLFNIPNRISIKNVTGLSTLLNGLIHVDDSFDIVSVPNSRHITIELDETSNFATQYPLMHKSLIRFLSRYKGLHDLYRSSVPVPVYGAQKTVSAGEGKAKFTFEVDTKVGATAIEGEHISNAFIVTTTAIGGGAASYSATTTSILHISGLYYQSPPVVKRITFDTLLSSPGGLNGVTSADIVSAHWGEGDTGSQDIAYNVNEKKITIVFDSPNPTGSTISIIPIHGKGLDYNH